MDITDLHSESLLAGVAIGVLQGAIAHRILRMGLRSRPVFHLRFAFAVLISVTIAGGLLFTGAMITMSAATASPLNRRATVMGWLIAFFAGSTITFATRLRKHGVPEPSFESGSPLGPLMVSNAVSMVTGAGLLFYLYRWAFPELRGGPAGALLIVAMALASMWVAMQLAHLIWVVVAVRVWPVWMVERVIRLDNDSWLTRLSLRVCNLAARWSRTSKS